MNEAREILHSLFVYIGSSLTLALAIFERNTVTGIKDTITILVGLATLIFTIYKIIEKHQNLTKNSKNSE